jgi:hypothetical protein
MVRVRTAVPVAAVAFLALSRALRAAADDSLGIVVDSDLFAELPLASDPWASFRVIDAESVMDRFDNGGLYLGEAAAIGIHGASWTQTSFRFGELDVTDPDRGGTPLLRLDPSLVQSARVDSGLATPQFGGSGPVIVLEPRRPGDAWHGALTGAFVPSGWQSSRSAPAPIARYAAFDRVSLRLDGPIAKDRAGLVIAGWLERVRRRESGGGESRGSEGGLFARTVWKLGERDELRLLGLAERVERPYAGRARLRDRDVRDTSTLASVQAAWERSGTTAWVASGGYVRGSFQPDLAGRDGSGVVERLRDGPVPALFPGEGVRERAAIGLRGERSVERFAGARHELRFGLSGEWTRATTRPEGPRGFTAESVDGLPARAWDYGWAGRESRRRALAVSLDAWDGATYGRLSLGAGLRFQATHGRASGAPRGIEWRGFSPRVFARGRVTRGDAVSVFGGYARSRDRLPLALLAFGDPAAPQGLVHRWRDTNANGRLEPEEIGPLIARVGPGGAIAAIDPTLEAPRTSELVLGLDAQLGGGWLLRTLALRRHQHDLVASVNVGVGPSDYVVTFIPDPAGNVLGPADDQLLPIYDRRPESFGHDRYELRNPIGESLLYEGIELSLAKKLGERWRVLVGGMAFRNIGPGGSRGFRSVENDQGVIGERLENPNATTFSKGRLFFDRSYTARIAVAYRGPRDWKLAALAWYQDGQPFSRLVIAPELGQGPEAIQAIANGRSRFTYALSLDARVEKGVKLGRVRVAGVLEVFNLLDMANEVEERVVSGASFREVTAVQPARALRLGARVEF